MESSLDRKPGSDTVKDIRDQYHNLRIRLLEQIIGARMLTNNNDLGEEHERIWQQFIQNQLGPTFIVLRGGHILDHSGRRSDAQIDLIVVAAGASFITPGDSEGGKANVFIDDVIAAIMLTTNLTTDKLKSDWGKLQSLPDFTDKTKDHPNLEKDAWPLCYIFSSQSCPIDALRSKWEELAKTTTIKFLPQVLVSLDGGSMFSGAMAWPRPRYPGNYTQPDHVKIWSGLDTGMGIAWALLQIRGRLAAIEKRALGSIVRFAGLLDKAGMKEATPPTWSPRFNSMFRKHEIAGNISWGMSASFAHNRLALNSVRRAIPGTDGMTSRELYKPNIDPQTLDSPERDKHLRWFRYDITHTAGNFLALEEWEEIRSKENHRTRIAVFNIATGEEMISPEVKALQSVTDIQHFSGSV